MPGINPATAEHRHRCEVRQLIRWRTDPHKGPQWLRDYLRAPQVAARRAALVCDIQDQLRKGHAGEEGIWL